MHLQTCLLTKKKNPQQFDTLIGSGIFQNLSKYYNQQYTNKLSV